MGLKEEQLEVKLTGYRVSKKNAPQFLLDVSSYKHARKLGHNSLKRCDPQLRLEYKNFSERYSGAEI